MDTKERTPNTILIWALMCSCLIAIAFSFYYLYSEKNFDYIVETSCDPLTEICFQRDCSDPDNCPPNGLSDFKRYTVNAGDFRACEDEDCTLACESGVIECVQVECEEDILMGETCSSPAQSFEDEEQVEETEGIIEATEE